ncbi:hypothetical protein [Aquimarina latercula]|uniref:hypothetical protein n=1 Tax=Aquimarina latercula TaxID=987 RepID=UPI0003FF958D|nr:hypothetical protein [Aquimarina latercula]
MKELMNDLHLYELVLLGLGVLLFLILSAGLVYYIVKKEEIKKLLFFFLIPILMIGYPSIQEFSISKDKIAFTKYHDEVISNPKDSLAKQRLSEVTEKLQKRAKTPEDIIKISEAKLLLGKSEEAIKYADKAIQKQEEENAEERATGSNTDDSIRTKTAVKAVQLKNLAEIQNINIEEVDKGTLQNQLKSITVSRDLEAVKKVVAKKTLQKYRRSNN